MTYDPNTPAGAYGSHRMFPGEREPHVTGPREPGTMGGSPASPAAPGGAHPPIGRTALEHEKEGGGGVSQRPPPTYGRQTHPKGPALRAE